jgi:hypothetical protein
MMKADEELIRVKALLQAKDQEILGLHANWKQLHEDFSASVRDYKILQQ